MSVTQALFDPQKETRTRYRYFFTHNPKRMGKILAIRSAYPAVRPFLQRDQTTSPRGGGGRE